MNTIHGLVLTTLLAGMAATVSAAPMSAADAAAVCKARAAAEYGSGDRAARVKFKGIYGGNTERKVRLQILPAGGKAFLAVCAVDGRSGQVVSISPGARVDDAVLAAVSRD